MSVEITALGGKVINIARKIRRYQDKLYFRYRRPMRLLRHKLSIGYQFIFMLFLWLFLVGSLALGIIFGAEKLLATPVEQRSPFRFLVPLANWLTGLVATERVVVWLGQVATWIFQPWLLWIFVFIVITAPPLFLIWQIPRMVAKRPEVKKERRQEVLQKILQPVPSLNEMKWRYVVVFLVIFIGLSALDKLIYQLGYCLVGSNNNCERVVPNYFIWLILAAAGAAASIWKMYEARVNRQTAYRQLMNLKKPTLCRIKDAFNTILSATVLVILFIAVLAVAVLMFDIS